MGTFCTVTSLDTIITDLTIAGTDFSSLADKCIQQSENKIRELLSRRYDMSAAEFQTSTSTPPAITTICEWLSASYFHAYLSRGSKAGMDRAKFYKDMAYDNLDRIIAGQVDVVNSAGSALTEQGWAMTSTTKDYIDTFDEGSPISWGPDIDKLESIEDDRESDG